MILLLWFLYTQFLSYTKNYYREIEGTYAGFTKTGNYDSEQHKITAGLIMYIRDVNDKGFFKGDIEFGEMTYTSKNNFPEKRPLSVGIHFFLGKLNYKFFWDRIRNPLKPEENRKYLGKLYILDRLDFLFETIKMEQYLRLEYDIVHFREMKAMKFTLNKAHQEISHMLPDEFILFQSKGYTFEPLKGVKDLVTESFK